MAAVHLSAFGPHEESEMQREGGRGRERAGGGGRHSRRVCRGRGSVGAYVGARVGWRCARYKCILAAVYLQRKVRVGGGEAASSEVGEHVLRFF